MKKIFTFICALVLSINISAQTPLTEALDFQATAHHGEEIDLFEILDNGQFVVLDFFFTTCHFCNECLPYLIEAYYELGENKEDVYFMEVSPTDHNRAPFFFVDKYIEQYSVPFPTLHTETGGMKGNEIYDMYQIQSCPTLVFIAPDHKIILQDYSVYKTKSTEVIVRDFRRLMKGYYMESLAAPANLTAKAITETAALLSWDEVDGAYRYNIYLGDSLVAKDVAETSYLMTKHEVGKEYCYNVTATYLERESAHSEPACVTTEEGMTFASPTNVTATPTNDSTIVLAWNPVEKADSYKVYRGTELLATVTDTTYTEEGLEAEIQYCYVVTSCLKTIESVASEEVCATTLAVPEILAAPTNLRATIRQDVPDYDYKFEITVAWDAVEGAKGYDVFVNTEKEQNYHMGYTNGTEYVMFANQEITFEFYVVAFNDETESEPSEICTVNVVNDGSDPSSSLIFFYEGNEITNTVNEITIESDINVALEIQFDLVVGNSTANDMNVVCEMEDLSNVGQSYICWGSCYMPGITEVVNTVYAGSSAQFNGHTMFVDEEWNELPKGTVIPIKYTFYDESNPSEQYVFNVKFIYENDDTANYWTPDESLYANNMTIITTVEIDGEEQYNPNLELGAFCNGELRGSARLQYVDAPANRYECFLMVYGNSGDEITFRLYDHGTGLESDFKSSEVVDFEVNATIGDIVNPYIINFKGSVLHSRALNSGWNWYSTYVINEGAEGLANLEAAVGANGIQIKNQTKFVNQASGNWYGTLTSTAVEDMFMIQMSAAHTLNLEGYVVNPADHPITLGTNWKWISYPLAAEMSVEEAFASANPSNGDYVKSQKGFAQYYEGLGWSGTLKTMTPGMGYMYQNTSGYAKTLVYPNAGSKTLTQTQTPTYWEVDANKYPMNMTVIAVVEGMDADYEVAALCNGECRGSARPVYIEALGQSMVFLTIYGDDNDDITFKYYDVTTGEVAIINEEMTFEINATHGDIMQPYVLTMSTMGIDEASAGFNIYPNPVQDKLYIETEAEVKEVVVYDVYGRIQNLRNSETQLTFLT